MFGKQLPLAWEILARKLIDGYSPLVVIVGDETGIGKSMLAGKTAEKVYFRAFGKKWLPKTDKEQNLFFRMSDFRSELFESKNRIFIVEEAEIELGSDDWHSIQNKYFNRMKSTQRIKGNLYIVVLPIFMDLARRHRRAVNYMFDVKQRGFFNAYKIVKNASKLLGDEIRRFYLSSLIYGLPNCKNEYDNFDIKNKKLIEIAEGRKLENIMNLRKVKRDKIKYEYTCEHCGFIWQTTRKPSDSYNSTCRLCKKKCFWDNENVKQMRILT